jgi:hypothetical protein
MAKRLNNITVEGAYTTSRLCAVLVPRAALKGVLSPSISIEKHCLALEPVVSEGLSGLPPLESCHNSIHKSS